MFYRVLNPATGASTDCRTKPAAHVAYKRVVAVGVDPVVYQVDTSAPGCEAWTEVDVVAIGWVRAPGVLPDSGAISLGMINTEFKRGSDVNSYRGTGWYRPNGQSGTFSSGALGLDEFHGKQANSPEANLVIASHVSQLDLWSWAKTQGWDGTSKLQVTINAGVWVYSDNTGVPALSIVNSYPGGVSIINNGYIAGRGGNGGLSKAIIPTSGGAAISIGTAGVSIQNNSYIGGGGGGGSGVQGVDGGGKFLAGGGGGGGAGGGSGAGVSGYAGGGGGAPGGIGDNGGSDGSTRGSGGGGGRIFPGEGGAGAAGVSSGKGGGAGGGGGAGLNPAGPTQRFNGGGGGGWGAAGGQAAMGGAAQAAAGNGGGANLVGNNGAGTPAVPNFGAGGKAVALNGNTITWITLGTVYGAVS